MCIRDSILQGYLKALDMLDEVIALIRASEDTDTARTGLMGLLDIDQVQADAILAMQLRTLTRMNRDKIVAEHEELQRKIADYIELVVHPMADEMCIRDRSWTFEEVDAKLKSIMEEIVANSLAAAKEYGHEGDLMLGANAAGFVKVANAMVAQGVL